MDIKILDTDFKMVGVIDSYISFIWTDRYDEAGDFVLILPMDTPSLDLLQPDYYLSIDDSEHMMIIEDMKVTTDVEDGKTMKVIGSSLEKLLDRRIIWEKTVFKQTYEDDNDTVGVKPLLQDAIAQILQDNIIYPISKSYNYDTKEYDESFYAARQISNFKYVLSDDTKIKEMTIEAQYRGESIYEVISSLCKEHEIGFKITLNDDYQFVFQLYRGAERTYDQFENPYVVFSPANDNLFNSTYYRVTSTLKNVALVLGEQIEDDDPQTEEEEKENDDYKAYRSPVIVGMEAGLTRREIFTDASDVEIEEDDDTTLTVAQYRAHLKQKGIDTLIEKLDYEAFEGEVEATQMYKYNEDFFMGDRVQLEDEYGHEGKAYISEFIISHDTSGMNMYPTFITIQEGEYDVDE